MINLKIDGKTVQAGKNATILEAAETAGIRIPTLCFLKKVSPTGACRICVVEIEGVDKPMAACHTQATDGMVVTTQSPRLHAIRKQIIELLLVNHPLDCPVCDAAGECELQNITYEFNVTRQPFEAEDVNPDTIDRWPLIQQVPNRCVLCEKCVKVCHESVGSSALYVNDKGDKAFIDKHLHLCEFCGNCVQVCPTGTMISKTFKFRARPWELAKTASVCTLCPAHCQVDLHVKNGELYRVTSQDGTTVNDGNLCIGGFFGYGYVNAEQRLTAPRLGAGEAQVEAGWEQALATVVEKARAAGPQGCAGLVGGRLSNEEYFQFQKLFRQGLGSNNIDSEARFGYLRAVATLNQALGLTGASNHLERIGKSEAVLVFGADPTAEAPAVDWQIELACRKRDGQLLVANLRQVKLSRHANVPLQYRPGSEVALANALARLVLDQGLADEAFLGQYVANPDELKAALQGVDLEQAVAATGLSLELLGEAAGKLGRAGSVALVFGGDITRGGNAEAATRALANLALVCGALHGEAGGLFPLDNKGNLLGALDMGVAPELLPGQKANSAAGLDANGILAGIEAGQIRFLYLAGVNPLVSFPETGRWRQALAKIDCLVVQDIQSSELTRMASVVLPGASFAEKAGSVTALDGRISDLKPALKPRGAARADLEIFGRLLKQLTGEELPALPALQQELKAAGDLYEDICYSAGGRKACYRKAWSAPAKGLRFAAVSAPTPISAPLQLLAGKSMFQFGSTTTFAKGPAEVLSGCYIEINPADADGLGIKDGSQVKVTAAGQVLQAPAKVSTAVPQGLVFAPVHFAGVSPLTLLNAGQNLVAVELGKA